MSSDTAIRCGLIGVSAGDSQEDLISCLRSVIAQSDVFDVTIFVAMETGLKIEHLPDLKFPSNVTLKIIDVQAVTNLSVKLNRLIEEVRKQHTLSFNWTLTMKCCLGEWRSGGGLIIVV